MTTLQPVCKQSCITEVFARNSYWVGNLMKTTVWQDVLLEFDCTAQFSLCNRAESLSIRLFLNFNLTQLLCWANFPHNDVPLQLHQIWDGNTCNFTEYHSLNLTNISLKTKQKGYEKARKGANLARFNRKRYCYFYLWYFIYYWVVKYGNPV